MATKELRNRVDDQWRQQASLWGQENHDRERKLIYDYFDQDENIVGLVGCTWGPISAFEEDAGFVLRQQRLKGAAVATDLSVYLVSHKGFSKLVTQMPLPSITAVEHANGIVTVAGDAIHNWAGKAQDDPFQIRDVHRGWGARFAQSVQGLQAAPPSTVTPPSADQYLGMSKAERIDAQWQDRSPVPGRKYDSERKKLHDILDDDEDIEYWMGGRWGLPDDFRSYFGGQQGTGNEGIAVATDRRVLLLGSGLLGPKEVELPCDRIDDVGYNDGMITSGVKFLGSTIEPYSFYFDHNNKVGVKGQARRLLDCVQQRLAAPPDADAD